jgi:hypothetical protein
MKKLLISCAALWASPALAADAPGEPKGEADHLVEKSGGKFSLLATECKAEDEGGVEATPGSPPLDVDDTGTPGCNGWEINIVTSGELGKAMSFDSPLLDINYGIGDNVQLKVEAPYQFTRIDGVNHGGVGAAEVGIKHRFFEDESRDLSIAVYPQVEFAIPGTAAAGEAEGTLLKFPVLMSTKIGETSKGDVMLTANLAYNASTSAETGQYVSAALGVGFPLTRNVALMLEGTTEQALTRNMDGVRTSVFKADLALFGKISPHLMLFGAAGQNYASSESEDASHTCFVLGFRLLAGGP